MLAWGPQELPWTSLVSFCEEPRAGGPPSHLAAFSPGSDVVDWLYHNVEGFTDRREARKYASNLLKAGFIRHTVNKITFSEQCYYIFGDLCGSTCLLHLLTRSADGVWGDAWGRGQVRHSGAGPGLALSSMVETESSLDSSCPRLPFEPDVLSACPLCPT